MSTYTLDTARGRDRWLLRVEATGTDAVQLDMHAVGLRSVRHQAVISPQAARDLARALSSAADLAESTRTRHA